MGAVQVTPDVACHCEDETVVYFHGQLPVISHRIVDVSSFGISTAQLIAHGSATPAPSKPCRLDTTRWRQFPLPGAVCLGALQSGYNGFDTKPLRNGTPARAGPLTGCQDVALQDRHPVRHPRIGRAVANPPSRGVDRGLRRPAGGRRGILCRRPCPRLSRLVHELYPADTCRASAYA